MEQLRQKHVQGSPVNVATIYVLTVILMAKPMLESYVRKTVPQVTIKREHSTTRAQPAPQVNFLAHGININANRGPIAPPASTSLPTAQAARTVFAAAVWLENILRMLTKVHAPLGQLAVQARR